MVTKTKTQEVKQELTQLTSSEIDTAFEGATDFREVGERITAPLEEIISETAKVIDADPIMNVSQELGLMNDSVQSVYSEIIDNDGSIMKFLKNIPLLGGVVGSLDAKLDQASFDLKGIEGKIQIIFSGFDTAYNSVNTSVDMQKQFINGIENNLGLVINYKDYIVQKIEEFSVKIENTTDEREKEKLSMFINNVSFFKGNLEVLIGNLDMARKRLEMRLDSAQKLSLAMNTSRPIFKVLLSTAIIETSSQKAIDASMAAMEIMGATIDKMSSDLTDKAIASSKKAEEVSSNPVLSTQVFIKNVEKLKSHFESIEQFRLEVGEKANEERKAFSEAYDNLEEFKVLTAKENDELEKQLQLQ